ncbi:MAG: hypothetical protein ACI9SP_004296 [Arenicella sp.]|jgi:hypothetical protein
MSLKKLYKDVDLRRKGEVFEKKPLIMDPDYIDQFHKDLVAVKNIDIEEKYRVDVREFLTSTLPDSNVTQEELDKLDRLLLKLQEDL